MDKLEMLKKRLMACFIDCVLIGSVAIILHIPIRLVLPSYLLPIISSMIFLFAGFIILAKDGPTWFIEVLRGQSPGKKAVGLIVTKLDGKTNITFQESIVRNIPIAVPYVFACITQVVSQVASFVPILGGFIILGIAAVGFLVSNAIILFEVYMMYKDPDGRRWGDHKAVTKVIPYD